MAEPRKEIPNGIMLDYDMLVKYDHPRRMKFDGNLDLIKAVVRSFRLKRGADLWVHSDAPPGSRLGSSSTLVVALILGFIINKTIGFRISRDAEQEGIDITEHLESAYHFDSGSGAAAGGSSLGSALRSSSSTRETTEVGS